MSEETIPQMRERIETLEAEKKASVKAQVAAEGKARLFEARDAFREAGYKPDFAELFVGAHQGDITKEAVSEFSTKYGFSAEGSPPPVPEEPAGTVPDTSPGSTALAQVSRAGSRPGDGGAAPAGTQTMTRDAWNELNKENPAAARVALQEGRVEIRKDNFYARNAR